MKKIKITRDKMVALIGSAKQYSASVGVDSDKLSNACAKMLEYDPNVETMTIHNKRVKKMHKQLERDCRDAAIDFAQTVDGILTRDKSGNLEFTSENQKLMNKAIDKLNDKYTDDLDLVTKETVEFYIPNRVTDVPVKLTSAFRKSLSLLID